jgi:hypothetical protein
MLTVAGRVVYALQARGVAPMVFRSGGGRGVHVWALWDEPQDAYSVRQLARDALAACELRDGTGGVKAGEVEVFPKQDSVPPDGSGNFIFLPFTGLSELLEPALNFAAALPMRDLLSEHWPMSEPVPKRDRPPKPERPAAPAGNADRARLRRALAAIPNDGETALPYDTWRNVVFGIMHGCGGDAEGEALAHEFSARAAKYDPEFLDNRVLPYVKPDGGVTVGTVFKLAREHGWSEVTADDFDDLGDAAAEGGAAPGHGFLTADDYAAQPLPKWRIDRLLIEQGCGFIYGASKAGKSLLALDMALAIARGAQWRGRPTVAGRVAYVVAEGQGGMRKRVRALKAHHGPLPPEFMLTDGPPNLRDPKSVRQFIARVKRAGGADVVFFDTLAQVVAGANENSGEDMGVVIGHVKDLARELNALVLLVHHAGKDDSREERGWSGMPAAMDVSIKVLRGTGQASDRRTAEMKKVKDDEDGLVFPFALRRVYVGEGETSCVIEHLPDPEPAARKGRANPGAKLKGRPRKVFEAVERLTADGIAVSVGRVADEVAAGEPFDVGALGKDGKPKEDRRREFAMTCLRNLGRRGLIRLSGGGTFVEPPGFADLDAGAADD